MHTLYPIHTPFPAFPVQSFSPLEPTPRSSLPPQEQLAWSDLSVGSLWNEQVLPALKARVDEVFSIPPADVSVRISVQGGMLGPQVPVPRPFLPPTQPTNLTLLRRVEALRVPSAREQRRAIKQSRATRAAAQLARAYDWEEGFQQLEEYLDRERWGQLKTTLEREIRAGLTLDEFELFLALRSFTDNDDRFVMSHYGYRHVRTPLSWPLALRFIRRTNAETLLATDELEVLLERTLDYTQAQTDLLELRSFADRLECVLDSSEGQDLDHWLSREGF